MTSSINGAVLLLLLSIGGGVVLWSHGDGTPGNSHGAGTLVSTLLDVPDYFSSIEVERVNVQANVQSPLQSESIPNNKLTSAGDSNASATQKRSLRRTNNNNNNNGKEEIGEGTNSQILSSRHPQRQLWYNPITIPKEVFKGLRNVGWFSVVWFAAMFAIGGSMRCYLCCNAIWTDRIFNPRRLYYIFADREIEPGFDNETEGIALDTLRTDGDDNESDGE